MLLLVGGGRQNLVRFKLVGNPTWPSSLHAHLENAPYHLGGFRVNQPVLRIFRVFHIAVRDIDRQRNATLTLRSLNGPNFTAGIPRIEFVR